MQRFGRNPNFGKLALQTNLGKAAQYASALDEVNDGARLQNAHARRCSHVLKRGWLITWARISVNLSYCSLVGATTQVPFLMVH